MQFFIYLFFYIYLVPARGTTLFTRGSFANAVKEHDILEAKVLNKRMTSPFIPDVNMDSSDQ